ncbi:hypothetical protein V8F20_010573 [Naviculisporaceae sp. PSN 640]
MSHEQRRVRPRSSSAPPTGTRQTKTSGPPRRARRSSFNARADYTIVPLVPGSYRATWHPQTLPRSVITLEPIPDPVEKGGDAPEDEGKHRTKSADKKTVNAGRVQHESGKVSKDGSDVLLVPALSPLVATSEAATNSAQKRLGMLKDERRNLPGKSNNAETLYAGLVRSENRKIPEDRILIPHNAAFAVRQAQDLLFKASTDRWILLLFGDCSAILNPTHTVPMKGAYAVSHPNRYGQFSWGAKGGGEGEATTSTWKIEKTIESTNGELLAMVEALNIAKYLRTTNSPWSNKKMRLHIHICNDSQHALRHIKKGQNLEAFDNLEESLAQPLVAEIIRLFHELESERLFCRVIFHWIPGHGHNVEPHIMADECSRWVAKGLSQEFVATILRGSGNGSYDRRYHNVPPYIPIGRGLQELVLQIALRHPTLDHNGAGLSERGRDLAAKRAAASMAPNRPWIEGFAEQAKGSVAKLAKKILCGSPCGDASSDENPFPPRPTAKRKEQDSAPDCGREGPSAPKRVRREYQRTANAPLTSSSLSISADRPRPDSARTQRAAVPSDIAKLMARKHQFAKP